MVWAARCLAAVVGVVLLSACGGVPVQDRAPEGDSAPAGEVDLSAIPDAVPRVEPKSRYGNPHSYVIDGKRYFTLPSARGFVERGVASWYGKKFHGRRTSSGEIYDMYGMTAAHKALPLPTYVSVRNLSTGREIVVRVNDRGPFLKNRIIDLSYAAATKLGIARQGTGFVEVRALEPGSTASGIDADSRQAGPAQADPAGIFIQAGAFEVPENAAKLLIGLTAVSEVPIRVLPANHGGRVLYRVRLGPVPSVEEADRIIDALDAHGFGRPQIVAE